MLDFMVGLILGGFIGCTVCALISVGKDGHE